MGTKIRPRVLLTASNRSPAFPPRRRAMGCGTSKEAVISSDGSGRCSRKLFRRKSSVIATGAHQPVAAAAKDNGDGVKRHKTEAKALVKGGGDVASTVIAAKIVRENKDKEEVKKYGKEEVAVAAGDAKGKETASEKVASKADGVTDKKVVADQKGDVAVVENENGEAAVEERRDERRGEDEEVWSAEASDNEGASSAEKDIEEIAMEVDDDGGDTLTDAPVGVATVEDNGVVISSDVPATRKDEIVPYAPATVAGDDGDVDAVAAPVAKEDELVSFASAPLAEEVDGVTLPPVPVAEEVDVAAFTAAPVAKEGQNATFVDPPAAKKNASVASIDAPVTKEDESVTIAAAPAVTEDEGPTTLDSAVLTTMSYEDEIVTSPAAPAAKVDESLAFPATAPVTEEDLEEAAEQPTVSINNDDLRNDQETPEPTDVEEVGSEADDETEQANDAATPEEVVTVEEADAEPEETESVSRVPEEEEEETSGGALINDDGESDGKQDIDLNDATKVEGGDDQLTVEAKKDDDDDDELEKCIGNAAAPLESSS
ncbi:unnamed protein product [Alopecurus aequalis]